MRDRALLSIVFAVVFATAIVACQSTPNLNPRDTTETRMSTEEATVRSGTGALRTDLEPLQKRFPLLGEAESATWMSGTLGDSGVPGPSTYWIDAIVLLPQAEFDRLLQSAGKLEPAQPPTLADGLQGSMPQGQVVSGAELDALFSTNPYQSEVYLDEATRQVVLRSIFE